MMNKVISKTKGVTLVSLTIVVTVILILTGVIIYNIRDSLGISKLREMQNDIQNLRELVNNYYATNGKIPAKLKYTNTGNIEKIRDAGVISEKVDIGDFYIIDLSELENLTLNYGEDYKNITDATTEEEASQYEDIYIINETSQNIFYVEGIELDGDWFYTDYTSEDVDSVGVDLRYVEGVKIPEGFYYVGGTKEEGIVISDNIEDLGKGDSSEAAENLQGNQFVWIPVENFDEFEREHFGTEAQKWWTGTFVTDGLSDNNFYEPASDGIMEDTEVEKMYKSVKENKGFYVGRYEAGTTESSGTGIRGEVVSKKGENVYNNIKWGNSMTDETGGTVEVARGMYNEEKGDSVTSTLIYGVQWDAIMRWMQDVPNLTGGKYVEDSTGMGWYSDNYSSGNANHQTGIDVDGGKNKVKNIYDLAGNVLEWTMESYSTTNRTYRGGDYIYSGSDDPVSVRRISDIPSSSYTGLGFRVALYLNIEEKWSPTYDEEGIYTDKNGDTAYIPKGFQVSEENGKNKIDEGLVIRNATTDDRYVWIEVPKGVFTTAASRTDYEKIEQDLQIYTIDYKEGYEGYTDEWYEGCGIASEREYNDLKNEMLSSIYTNGGFYISQYEIGASSYVTVGDNGAREPVSKEGMYPYNYVTVAQAQNLATNMDTGEKRSSLMFGIQWDLACTFIESKGAKTQNQIKVDSSEWGNYRNAEFPVAQGNKYATYDFGLKEWVEIPEEYIKPSVESGQGTMLSTGATERNSVLNIYDLAGNLSEWTLEKSNINNSPCSDRGGTMGDNGSRSTLANGNEYNISTNNSYIAFRVCLF